MMKIIGAGGGGKDGGGGGRIAQEEADTLQSKSYAQVLDLISEGEIEGLVDGKKSIYLDDTPLVSSDGTENFSGISWDFRHGTQSQGYIPGFPSSENEVSVGVEVKAATPVVRSITNANVTAINVRISIPQLTFQDPTNGDLKGYSVKYAIEVNSNGAGWVQKANDEIIGKCVSKYLKSYRIELSGSGPHEVRVRRITADSTQSNIVNKTYWDSYGEVVDVKLRYPNSAIAAIRVDAAQFRSIPKRSYDVRLMRVRVPSNYNSYFKQYYGTWDGTFKIAWTDNPAWIFYDLMTNERYGLGAHIDSTMVDKWSLYKISQYCDEQVDNGFGGKEARFTCNCYFQTRTEAYNLMQDLAGVFRSMAYWSSGLMVLSQDAPQDAAHLFTPSNVINGEFQYQGASRRNRYSVALVSWNDPSDMYRPKIEYVEDQSAITRFGVVQSEVVAFGCTSRGQAHRFGKWLLYTSQLETETVTFQTGLEAAVLRPGQVVKIQDPMRAGGRLSGRVGSATTTQVTIDHELTVSSFGYSISVMLDNGTVEERSVDRIEGKVVYLSTALPQAPQPQSVWLLKSFNVTPQTFRIVSVSEDNGVYSVTALAHDPSKYDFIEKDLQLVERKISSLGLDPVTPTGLKVTETLYETNGEVRVKATFSWDASPNAATYITQYRTQNGNIVNIGENTANEIEVLNIEPGQYEFYVIASSALGKKSAKSKVSYKVIGKAYPPGNVQGFSLIPMADVAYLSWEKSSDLDVLIGGSVRIRYSPNLGALWKDSVDVGIMAGNATRAPLPLMSGTYLAKFVDSSGNSSITESIIETTGLEALKKNVIIDLVEHPTFPGVKNSMIIVDYYGGLSLAAGFTIDEITTTIDEVPSFDYMGGVASSGSYEFNDTVDLTQVYTSDLRASIEVAAVDVGDTIDLRLDPVDMWQDLDGAFIDDVNAEIFVKTTEDDPASPSAVWTEWKRFFIGQYKARGFRFKVEAKSWALNHSIIIKKLSLSVDMPDRVVNMSDIVSNTLGSDVVFEAPFAAVPSIGITASNLQSGDFYVIENKTASGFKITFKNSAGTPVVRTFDVIAKGYGRKV